MLSLLSLVLLSAPEPPPSPALLGIAARDLRAVTHPFACGGCEQQLVIVIDDDIHYGGTGSTNALVGDVSVTIDWPASNNFPGECHQDPQCVQKKPCEIDFPVITFTSTSTWHVDYETWNNTTMLSSGSFPLPLTHYGGLSGGSMWQPPNEQHPGYWAYLDCGQRLEYRATLKSATETHTLTLKFVCTNCFHYN